ncbi:endo alpha-1,4 polygalactosaminidase [Actinoplanes sp. N902-109]|uniref:endo alpha-1,4 polygalactosaminidase n=1 Tax=Actinoplanes sp. (strain N902-109) TaxID=649831 RepID=UPI0003295514|nr:endo alpha-1,4 polygalactosaminidase [Actinoplanes sp. N902-109]AGL16681.1 secreted protein [Actinoplanes sp. N902-109]
MAVNRKRLKVGVAMAAVLVVALGAGIGTADAGTRRPWSAKPTKPAATPTPAATSAPTWAPPPANATFDYQIGGAYQPPAGVTVVSRDREAAPAAGIYTICYVNAFQAQPGTESWWQRNHPDLILRDGNGDPVVDEDWNELMLDFSTEAKRTALTGIVGEWIDGCAADGFRAIEADNLDSYTRSQKLLTQDQAVAYATALNSRAHDRGLAAGQKNTAELSSATARKAGFDFAVAEECADFDECDAYTATYGSNVIVIEYSRSGFSKACASVGSKLSVVLRDVDVTTPGSRSYTYGAC